MLFMLFSALKHKCCWNVVAGIGAIVMEFQTVPLYGKTERDITNNHDW